jgi:hypothetical protein
VSLGIRKWPAIWLPISSKLSTRTNLCPGTNPYSKNAHAAEAGEELVRDYGFRRFSIHDPDAAPLGADLWRQKPRPGRNLYERRFHQRLPQQMPLLLSFDRGLRRVLFLTIAHA